MAECVIAMKIWDQTNNGYCITHETWVDADPDRFGANPEHEAAIAADKGVQK